jgi:hypothetical protein
LNEANGRAIDHPRRDGIEMLSNIHDTI